MADDDFDRKKHSRIEAYPEISLDQSQPRIGRRESEPHSIEITYIWDVLKTNFPSDRTLWDLNHYFIVNEKEINLRLDISFFRDLSIPYTLSSYNASDYENRIPDLAINILSKSTWSFDLSENVDLCRMVQIPLYIIFAPYHVASETYKPPFLRVYRLTKENSDVFEDLHDVTLEEGGEINSEAIIDTSDIVPFRVGLMKLNEIHDKGKARYRMIFIDPSELKILQTEKEHLIVENRELHQKLGDKNED